MSIETIQSRKCRSTASTYDVVGFESTPTSTTDSKFSNERRRVIDHLIDTLLLFFEFKNDWDGNNAKAPKASLIRYALNFVSTFKNLDPENEIPIDATVAPDGAILFEFEEDNFELEFQPDFKVYLRYFSEEGILSTQVNSDLD